MQNLATLLEQNYRERSARPVLDDGTIFHICRRLIVLEYGVRGGENLEPRYYKKKKLFVSARTSLWAQEFHMTRETFIVLLNQELGQEAVREIKIESAFR